MALPTVVQMVAGRPALTLALDEHWQSFEDGTQRKCLVCLIRNSPITSPMLRKLGVRRETASDVYARVGLFQAGSGNLVSDYRVMSILIPGGTGGMRVNLPASTHLPGIVIIADAAPSGPVSWRDPDKPVVLHPGSYRAEVEVTAGETEVRTTGVFVVGPTTGDLYWSV